MKLLPQSEQSYMYKLGPGMAENQCSALIKLEVSRDSTSLRCGWPIWSCL